MNFEDITPEQRERAKACKTTEELLALAAEEGIDLNDEQLEAVSGGMEWVCSDKECSGDCSVFHNM